MKTDNELITEFMGLKVEVKSSGRALYNFPFGKHRGYCIYDKLKFHISWDWLMPAISKFNLLDSQPEFKYPPNDYYTWRQQVDNAVCTYSITEAHKIFVEALKWYNAFKAEAPTE